MYLGLGMTEVQVAKQITGHKDPKSLAAYNTPTLTSNAERCAKAIR